jgi:hypothetical protein
MTNDGRAYGAHFYNLTFKKRHKSAANGDLCQIVVRARDIDQAENRGKRRLLERYADWMPIDFEFVRGIMIARSVFESPVLPAGMTHWVRGRAVSAVPVRDVLDARRAGSAWPKVAAERLPDWVLSSFETGSLVECRHLDTCTLAVWSAGRPIAHAGLEDMLLLARGALLILPIGVFDALFAAPAAARKE